MTSSYRQRVVKYVGIALGALVLLALGAVLALHLSVDNTPRKPHSDVPVVWEVDQSPDAEHLIVTGLFARVIDSRMNLFNNVGLIGFTLEGHMIGARGSRPRFDRVQLAERVISAQGPFPTPSNKGPLELQVSAILARRSHVELDVMPLSSVNSDETYRGEAIPFSIKIEKWVHAIDWGPNRYVIRCRGFERELVLMHPK